MQKRATLNNAKGYLYFKFQDATLIDPVLSSFLHRFLKIEFIICACGNVRDISLFSYAYYTLKLFDHLSHYFRLHITFLNYLIIHYPSLETVLLVHGTSL
jgi:hypothetical protein